MGDSRIMRRRYGTIYVYDTERKGRRLPVSAIPFQFFLNCVYIACHPVFLLLSPSDVYLTLELQAQPTAFADHQSGHYVVYIKRGISRHIHLFFSHRLSPCFTSPCSSYSQYIMLSDLVYIYIRLHHGSPLNLLTNERHGTFCPAAIIDPCDALALALYWLAVKNQQHPDLYSSRPIEKKNRE